MWQVSPADELRRSAADGAGSSTSAARAAAAGAFAQTPVKARTPLARVALDELGQRASAIQQHASNAARAGAAKRGGVLLCSWRLKGGGVLLCEIKTAAATPRQAAI